MANEKVAHRQKAKSKSDLLSEVLGALHVDTSALFIFDLHEPWEIELDDIFISISWTVIEGTIWIHLPGGERIQLHRGDTFLRPWRGDGLAHVLVSCSDRKSARSPVRAHDLFRQMQLQGLQPGSPFPPPM